MNKLDTALVTSALKKNGFIITDNTRDSDVVLINTCSVREHAEEKVFSHLGNLKHLKKNRPGLVVAVIGCMAQRLGNKLFDHESVDIICGPTQLPQLVRLITDAMQKKTRQIEVQQNIRKKPTAQQNESLQNFESQYSVTDKPAPAQAFVRVMRGCNNFCTYCIVPLCRGPEVSRPPQAIKQQITKMAQQGVKQITLLGQTVNSYEYKNGEKTYCLADILETANNIGTIERIKFVTSYPGKKYFKQIIQAMAHLPKVCPCLHMPAQSGSDKILKAMNRNYTAEDYLNLITQARQILPSITIAGDFIIGFPGETDQDFRRTMDLLEQVRYRNCFIFRYSPRKGTAAHKNLADSVPAEVKKERNSELLDAQKKISHQLSRTYLDKQVTVLTEGPSKKSHLNDIDNNDNPQLTGRTAGDYIVVFNGPADLAGQFAKVKITKVSPWTLFGRLIK